MYINKLKRFISTTVYATLLKICSYARVSSIIGAKTMCFSLTHAIAPVWGMYAGIRSSSMVFAIRTIMTLLWAQSYNTLLLACHIPTLAATCYLSLMRNPSNFRRGIAALCPIACAIAFICHPTGMQAVAYTSFWIIPVITALYGQSMFMHALGSTFTAHAVGSVIWLYTMPISATSWLALMPIVCLERLTFALGITTCYYVLAYSKNMNTQTIRSYITTHVRALYS
jgi:hypothetical protein